MVKKLKKIFSSLIVNPASNQYLADDYHWFSTETNEVVGIHEKELTEDYKLLLSTFLTPVNLQFPIPTNEEIKWKKLIDNKKAYPTNEDEEPVRFIFFSIQKKQIDPKQFNEAIYELFSQRVPILWENEHEGIIIEKLPTINEDISFEKIIDVLISDLYVKIKFLVGSYEKNIIDVQHYYKNITEAANIAFAYSKKTVLTYVDAIPFILLNQASSTFRSEITSYILREMSEDEDMLKTIEVFFECNLNVTVAAKKMYMHRNSLQYRLDKFMEKTGINIQQFDQALTVYLALIARNQKKLVHMPK